MSKAVAIDLFAEDRGHEVLLKPLVMRIAREQRKKVTVQVRAARGGHSSALEELNLYQESVLKGAVVMPDLLIAAIDANCGSFNEARGSIQKELRPGFQDRTVSACPDPHVERWYL